MAFPVLDVQRVGVVGAGIMGAGIAQVAARAGYRTELFDVVSGAAQKALERVAESLARAVEKGRCTAAERTEALGRLTAATDLDALAAAADLIIEAAPENLELKRDLFAKLSKAARPEAILASNTSSLPTVAALCVCAASLPACLRPTLSTTTGLAMAAERSALMKRRALPMPSRYTMMLCVCESLAR